MSSLFAPMMVKQKSGLMIQVSSFGGVQYLFDVGYGVGKAGLDRLSADMAAELKPHGVYAITLHPGAAVTEVTAFPDGETPIFSGRAVTALLNKANKDHLEKLNGKVVQAAELAVDYDFVDIDGKMPIGVEITKTWRDAMSSPLIQYSFEADLLDPSKSLNHPDVFSIFPELRTIKFKNSEKLFNWRKCHEFFHKHSYKFFRSMKFILSILFQLRRKWNIRA